MSNNTSNRSRIGYITFILLLIILNFTPKIKYSCFADNDNLESELSENVDEILENIDLSELDNNSICDPMINSSMKDFVKLVLSGDYQSDYNSVISLIKNQFSEKIRNNLRFFISLLIITIIFVIFKNFCEYKFGDLKTSVKIIFSFLLATLILVFVKSFFEELSSVVSDLFSFADILFPILIGLLTLSGSAKSATVFSSFSVFLLETGSYIIRFILLPLSLSILLLSLFGSIFANGSFSKINGLFKLIFKYTIIIFFAVFGLLSTVNIFSSSMRDGLNLKLTKFAIKNYVPILGGYVSEGFDFVYTCSVLVKNALGVCSIIIIVFKILSPVLSIFVFSLMFKFVSCLSSLIGDGSFSGMFDDVSKALTNFLTIIVGAFLILFVFIVLVMMCVGVV